MTRRLIGAAAAAAAVVAVVPAAAAAEEWQVPTLTLSVPPGAIAYRDLRAIAPLDGMVVGPGGLLAQRELAPRRVRNRTHRDLRLRLGRPTRRRQ
ncbi:MAG TPA: hypothetical protein VLK58_01215 [Conexibacter sp.]|nr:hypothetical protein [Conexibacter sp.]